MPPPCSARRLRRLRASRLPQIPCSARRACARRFDTPEEVRNGGGRRSATLSHRPRELPMKSRPAASIAGSVPGFARGARCAPRLRCAAGYGGGASRRRADSRLICCECFVHGRNRASVPRMNVATSTSNRARDQAPRMGAFEVARTFTDYLRRGRDSNPRAAGGKEARTSIRRVRGVT